MNLKKIASASLALEFRIRVGSRKRMLQGLFGDTMMGYGARLEMGCKIGDETLTPTLISFVTSHLRW